jgi:hypothetical protein
LKIRDLAYFGVFLGGSDSFFPPPLSLPCVIFLIPLVFMSKSGKKEDTAYPRPLEFVEPEGSAPWCMPIFSVHRKRFRCYYELLRSVHSDVETWTENNRDDKVMTLKFPLWSSTDISVESVTVTQEKLASSLHKLARAFLYGKAMDEIWRVYDLMSFDIKARYSLGAIRFHSQICSPAFSLDVPLFNAINFLRDDRMSAELRLAIIHVLFRRTLTDVSNVPPLPMYVFSASQGFTREIFGWVKCLVQRAHCTEIFKVKLPAESDPYETVATAAIAFIELANGVEKPPTNKSNRLVDPSDDYSHAVSGADIAEPSALVSNDKKLITPAACASIDD